MDEKDKAIQDLRRENEKLKKWVEELEERDNEHDRFIEWCTNKGFGPAQFMTILEAYYKDQGVMS